MNVVSNMKKYNCLLLLIFGLFGCSSETINYDIENDGLNIKATVHSRFISKDSLILESLKIVDISNDHSYKPYRRVMGIGQPPLKIDRVSIDRYLEGWFLLNNDEIALIFLSEHKYAIYFKTRSKPPGLVPIISEINPPELQGQRENFSILLGTDNPEALIKMMREKWGELPIP